MDVDRKKTSGESECEFIGKQMSKVMETERERAIKMNKRGGKFELNECQVSPLEENVNTTEPAHVHIIFFESFHHN